MKVSICRRKFPSAEESFRLPRKFPSAEKVSICRESFRLPMKVSVCRGKFPSAEESFRLPKKVSVCRKKVSVCRQPLKSVSLFAMGRRRNHV
jgi:hypothetical protein